tara:strand:+ start:119 stop:709 length:591 start_codon:yes stop_codon:yes gene_type:complete
MNDNHLAIHPFLRSYLWCAAGLAILTGCLDIYLASQGKSLKQDCERAHKQLTGNDSDTGMVQKGQIIKLLQTSIEAETTTERQSINMQPLIPFLEKEAKKKQVRIRGIYPRPPTTTRRSVMNGTRIITEQHTEIQVGQSKLKNLALFLHSVEIQRPDYFVKELGSLTPNRGKGDSWRVRVILSKIQISDENGSGRE